MPDQMDEAKNIKRLKRTEKASQMLVNAMWIVLLLMVLGIGYALGVLMTPAPTAEPAPTAVPAPMEPYFVPVIGRTGQPQIVALKGIDRHDIKSIGYSYLNHAGELMVATPCWHATLCEWATPPVPMGYMMTVEVELKDGGRLQWVILDPNQEVLTLTTADVVVVEELP